MTPATGALVGGVLGAALAALGGVVTGAKRSDTIIAAGIGAMLIGGAVAWKAASVEPPPTPAPTPTPAPLPVTPSVTPAVSPVTTFQTGIKYMFLAGIPGYNIGTGVGPDKATVLQQLQATGWQSVSIVWWGPDAASNALAFPSGIPGFSAGSVNIYVAVGTWGGAPTPVPAEVVAIVTA